MAVKQSGAAKAGKTSSSTKRNDAKSVAKKAKDSSVTAGKMFTNNKSAVAGWIQDASLETSAASFGFVPEAGEREVEFSVAMRRRQEAGRGYAELRGRALIHARGNVLALAEASFVAEMQEGEEEARLVVEMYPPLREALQSLLEMAGHTPPLPESLENAA